MRAASMLDAALVARLPRKVDAGALLARIASLHQMTAGCVDVLMTSLAELRMSSLKARALAVAFSELADFVLDATPAKEAIRLYLALSCDGGSIVLAFAAEGDLRPVPSASAMAGLFRAIAIVEGIGGLFARGLETDRMVFGITFENHENV
ncbi:hypothetical protein [Sphingomonas morindae]|uniref:Uncharacterized protein n=1 Tax=Sphingomonas morindae TaxID=1541170 RepID=A0ABY4XB25_9SPHN|nr:hypothetical protein [Sphingomonas morindae]USI73941.1 hypothetical protein LHA26_05600 [Sphingomonas morindae]